MYNILIDEMLRLVNLSQGELVVVFVIKNVHQVGIKRVDILLNF